MHSVTGVVCSPIFDLMQVAPLMLESGIAHMVTLVLICLGDLIMAVFRMYFCSWGYPPYQFQLIEMHVNRQVSSNILIGQTDIRLARKHWFT